jgi:hypothetical protein
MAKIVTVKLFDPIKWFEKDVVEVQLMEPSGAQFAELGEPQVWVYSADGSTYAVEQTSVLRRYVEKSLKHEGGADLLKLMSLVDVMQVKKELLGFFTEASRRISTPKSAP